MQSCRRESAAVHTDPTISKGLATVAPFTLRRALPLLVMVMTLLSDVAPGVTTPKSSKEGVTVASGALTNSEPFGAATSKSSIRSPFRSLAWMGAPPPRSSSVNEIGV